MAEYVAGRGTTALGIIGTILGGIGTAGVLGNGTSLLGLGGSHPAVAQPYEMTSACMHDLQCSQEIAAKDAEIARLNSEKYADSVGLRLFEYIGNELKTMRADQNDRWTGQAVINANTTNGITALSNQLQATNNLVSQITKVAVPQSSVCNFGCGCSCAG